MGKYKAESSRIPIKFIDSKTENELFEIKDRNWMNMGEIFTAHYASTLVEAEYKNKKLPKKIMVLAVLELTLEEE
jgi:hypothetical protein